MSSVTLLNTRRPKSYKLGSGRAYSPILANFGLPSGTEFDTGAPGWHRVGHWEEVVPKRFL